MRAKDGLPGEAMATFERDYPSNLVEKFFTAVAWRQPLRPEAPPTLATAFRDGDFEAMRKLGIPLEKVLHAEQEFRFHAPVEPGIKYRGETFLKSQLEKQGSSGAIRFYVFQTNLIAPDGKVRAESLTTIIVKEGS